MGARPLRRLWFAAALAGAAACSPYGGGTFACTDGTQCGAGGTCEPNGLCSFADATCDSGRRYGEASGSLSGICVGDEPPDAAPGPDARVFDAFVAMDGDLCYGAGLVTVCLTAVPTGAVAIMTSAIDTDTGPECAPVLAPSTVCAIVGDTITVPGGQTLTAIGSRPLVVVAASTITVAGTIDVSSHRSPAVIGAGGNSPACGAGTAPTGGGGGYGGSFGGGGGNGGNGGGGVGGVAAAAMAATALRGGCAGANGGGGNPGGRGHGGGAVYLIAGGSITVDGTIAAAGSGGSGGVMNNSGGGGGGSGGMIGLDAPAIAGASSGRIFATGGGGGEGSGSSNTGDFGDDPTAPATAAAGGAGGSGSGGDGGAGASGAQPAGVNGTSGSGGGGAGGGGTGVIRTFGTSTYAGQIAPAPS